MNGNFEIGLFSAGLKSASMLAIVLALLIGFLYLMKRLVLSRSTSKGDLPIKVISSLHLSPKEKIQVIEISGEKIVLGISSNGINFLTKIQTGNEQR